jgi:SAM-dependent methyltransferase
MALRARLEHVIEKQGADRRLAAESLAQGDPTGWFEPLYAAAAAGDAVVPWDRAEPNALLVEWARERRVDGAGRRALVVGCGFGRDAEHVAALGFRTTAFDVAETAIRSARDRHPGSAVDYVVADLFNPPAAWTGAFDLVVESITVQAMPPSVRAEAVGRVRDMVAAGGELLVIAGIRAEGERADGPPWPLTRAEVESFEGDGLAMVDIERVALPTAPDTILWRAVFRRA